MRKTLQYFGALVVFGAISSGVSFAHGGGPMSSSPSNFGGSSGEVSPEEQAKHDYNAGIKSVKRAKEYEEDALKASSPEKKSKASDKAVAAYRKALEQFTAAAGNKPEMVEAWNYIGFANRHLGAYAQSLDAYDRALSLNPKFVDAIEYRGEAYLALNRLDDAKTAYMNLFRDARPLSDQLLAAMQEWVTNRRQDPKGVPTSDIDSFDAWINERGTVAKQTASLANGGRTNVWK